MKNLKIYKSALAILTATSILLLSGCSGENKKDENKEKKLCQHITIYFEDKPITIKECENYGEYDVSTFLRTNSRLEYSIKKDENVIISGVTSMYNISNVDHENNIEIFDNEVTQKTK